MKQWITERGTLWSQIVLGVVLFAALVPFLWVAAVTADTHDYSRVPSITLPKLSARVDRLQAIVNGPASSDPREYFRVVVETRRVEAMARKLSRENGFHSGPLDPVSIDFRLRPDHLQGLYQERFGSRMGQVAEELRPWTTKELDSFEAPPPQGTGQRVLAAFVRSAAASMLVAVLFFMARLKGEGLLIWPELVNGRLAACSVLWLGTMWFYPSRISPVAQVKRAVQFIGSLMAGAISFGAVAGAANADERKKDEGGADTGNVLVVSDAPRPAFSAAGGVVSMKVTGNGTIVHDGPVAWADANVGYDGWSLDFWASRSLSGSQGSDENDLTVSKSWKAGAWSPTASLAYYDIQPLGTLKGGDIVSPILQADRSIGHGLTLSAKAEAYVLTGAKPRVDGYDASLGLKGSHSFNRADVAQSVSAVYADGPFGQKAGLSLRYDGSAAVPLAERLKAILSVKAFAPLIGARDRRPNVAVGFGLAASF